MAKKYPTPDEARRRYEAGVEANKDRWVEGCRSGADDFQTWFTGFAKTIYPLVATLPAKTGNVDRDVDSRVKPVAKRIKALAEAYRKAKLAEVQKQLLATVPMTS